MANQSISETENRLRSENEELHLRLTEAEETLYAIRNGEVDAIVVSGAEGVRIFSLTSAETPYRIMVEEMHEGAATLMADTTIIHCNSRFAELVARPAEQIIGASFSQFISENEKSAFIRLFNSGLAAKSSGEITWLSPENEVRYFHLSFSPLPPEVTGDLCVIVSDFTERKQAEETLHAHVFLNSVIENSPNALWILDEQGTLNQMNQASRTLFNILDQDLPGKYNILNDPVFEEQGFKPTIIDVFEKAFMVRFVARYHTSSIKGIEAAQNLKLDLDVSISPILDAHGKVTNAVVQFIDITSSKLSEQKLLLANKELIERDFQYQNLANSGPSLLWSSGTDKLCNYFNNTWLTFTGRTLEQEIGNGWAEGVHPDDFDSCLETYMTAFDQRKPFEMDYRMKHASGEYKWILDLGTPNYNMNGEFIGYIGNCFDITERKKTEQKLKESEFKFKNLVWDMSVGVVIQGPQSEMLLSNPKALELLGLTEDQLLGKTSFDPDWNVIHEDGSPFPGETHPVPQAIASGLPVREVIMGVYNPITNKRAWLLVDAIPHLNADGNTSQVVCSFVDISKRKQAEEELKQSEERYRSLLTNLEAGIVVHAPDTSIIMNNMRASELLGLSDEQMKGRVAVNPDWKFIHPDGVPFQIDEYPVNRIIKSGKAINDIITGVVRSTGKSLVWLSVNGFPAYDDRGEISEVIISFIDITQRKQAEERLKLSEGKYRQLVNNTDIGFVVVDDKGIVVEANDPYLKLAGYGSFEEISGRSVLEWTAPDEVENNAANIALCAKQGYIQNFETVYLQADGTRINIILDATMQSMPDGKMLNVAFCRNITDRKLALDTLKKSEAEFRNLAESMPQIVWATRADGWNIYFNRQWMDYTGMTIEESYGHGWNKPFHPDDQQRAWDAWNNALENNRIYSIEARLRRFDGEYRWWLVRGVPQKNEKGNILKWFGTCTDIEEIKQTEKAIHESEVKLKEAQRIAHLGNWALNIETNELVWSDEIYRIFNCEPNEFEATYEAFLGFIHPDDREKVNAAYSKSLETKTDYQIEHRIITQNNQQKYVKEKCTTTFNEQGNPLNSFGIVIDITESKQAEVDLQRKMDELLQFQRLTVGRELKMIELKKEINELLKGSGKDEKYRIVE
jgi:PAS domain S-box-containing protein